MKIVFFGTPDYVVPVLDSLYKNFRAKPGEQTVVAVVTQPPRPSGRKKILEYSAVDKWAHKRNVPTLFEPGEIVKQNLKADFGVLASYGGIIPKEVINFFPKGILVIHPSLLPAFRWSSPVPAAIVTNTNPTGVTIFRMDEKFDHGPIVTQFKQEILPDDTFGTLRDRLYLASAEVLIESLPAYLKGKINLKPQEDTRATFSREIQKNDAFVPPKYIRAALDGKVSNGDWKIPFIKNYSVKPEANVIERLIRAMTPWPIAWTNINIKGQVYRLKLLKAAAQDKRLELENVQLEGKGVVGWKQFLQGYPEAKL